MKNEFEMKIMRLLNVLDSPLNSLGFLFVLNFFYKVMYYCCKPFTLFTWLFIRLVGGRTKWHHRITNIPSEWLILSSACLFVYIILLFHIHDNLLHFFGIQSVTCHRSLWYAYKRKLQLPKVTLFEVRFSHRCFWSKVLGIHTRSVNSPLKAKQILVLIVQ